MVRYHVLIVCMLPGYLRNNDITSKTPDFLLEKPILKHIVSTNISSKRPKNDIFDGFYGRKRLETIL